MGMIGAEFIIRLFVPNLKRNLPKKQHTLGYNQCGRWRKGIITSQSSDSRSFFFHLSDIMNKQKDFKIASAVSRAVE